MIGLETHVPHFWIVSRGWQDFDAEGKAIRAITLGHSIVDRSLGVLLEDGKNIKSWTRYCLCL